MLSFSAIVEMIFLAGTISGSLVFPIERLYKGLSIVDLPSERRIHVEPVARAGGIVILLSLIISLTIIFFTESLHLTITPCFYFFISLLSLVTFLGLIDDRYEITWKLKLLLQMLAIIIVITNPLLLGITAETYADRFHLFVFYLTLMNAINLIDGLNGLCILISIISLLSLLALSHLNSNYSLDLLLLIPLFVGTLAGIVFFNFKSPRIFLGESGSMLLGFSLATFFILSTQSINLQTNDRYITFALIYGLPLIELLSTCFRRFIYAHSRGKGFMSSSFSIVVADREHMHHRLLANNHSQLKTLCILCLLHCLCVIPVFIFY